MKMNYPEVFVSETAPLIRDPIILIEDRGKKDLDEPVSSKKQAKSLIGLVAAIGIS